MAANANSRIAHMMEDNGVILDNPTPFSAYRADYATGNGVLLRNLLQSEMPQWPT
jgi:hypothetical protein